MTRRLLLLTMCVAAVAGRLSEADSPESRWLTDLAKAEKESSKTGKPLFVVFRCEH
jgi:hypothetical protein